MSEQRYISPYYISLLFLSLGEDDKAFEWLGRAFDEKAAWMIYLSVDPRFKNLLKKIGFGTGA